MVIGLKVPLPTFDELECEEITLGAPTLKAGAFHLGKYCEEKNDEFMQCRQEEGRMKCINEGKEVTACTLEFFRKLKGSCSKELKNYANCIDQSSMRYTYEKCRQTQKVFDDCVLANLGIERPIYWYFTRPRVFASKIRSEPAPPQRPEFPDQPAAPTPEHGVPETIPGKLNSRYWSLN